MKYPCVFRESYISLLGQLELRVNSNDQLFSAEFRNNVFATLGHDVTIKRVTPSLDWLPQHMHVESIAAWMFYISKRNSSEEQLSISIDLITQDSTIICGSTTGERLVAIEFENGIRQMHIGTEDEDAMAFRASIDDYMPQRLMKSLTNYQLEITAITATGLLTQVPPLEVGEQFYFHYIVAENPCRQSVDYPNESDVSTWFAVEQSKKQLEQARRSQL